ncbi:MAG: prolyl oligopeptidase family serine peptidase [Candidatus Eisenbacteria bacterium]|nr:prolyl oligopeptidase family serine peptidase [Candidatus Eisenbacteria bacterium]
MIRRLIVLALFLLIITPISITGQAFALLPPDNLVLQGIQSIPDSIVAGVGRYTEFRTAAFWSWNPTKREMLIGTRFADTRQVHQVKFPGGARTQLTFFKDSAEGAMYHPTGGDCFIFGKDTNGDEFYQFYRYDFATGDVTLLTDGKSRNTSAEWSNVGNFLAYCSTRRNGKDVDLYVVAPSDPKTDHLLVQLEGGGWDVLDWSPDERTLLAAEWISANESYLWLVDAGTGNKTLLTPKGKDKIAYSSGLFSKDGKGIYVTTDRDSEFQRLTYIDLASKQHIYLTAHIKWDIDLFDLSHDGKTIAFVANEDGISVLHLLDTVMGKEKTAPKLPVGVIYRLRWHNNGSDLAFNFQSARSVPDIYSVNVDTGKIDRWTYSETGGVNTENFVEPELIRWKSFDGRMISGFLYRPPSKFAGKRPVVIDMHGGPEGQALPTFLRGDNYVLNDLGVAVLMPNIRGSSGYGKTFLKLDNGFLREDSYKDISALLDWIKTDPGLDAGRIMVTGASYGGHMTLAIATFYSDRIRCALDVVGMSNLVTFLENTQGYRRDLRRVEYGDERDPKMRKFMERIAPMNNLQMIKKPLMVVAGKNDPRVPVTESDQIVDAVRKNGVPVWYLMAKDEGHGFVRKKNVDFLLYTSVLFMKEYLLN